MILLRGKPGQFGAAIQGLGDVALELLFVDAGRTGKGGRELRRRGDAGLALAVAIEEREVEGGLL